MSVASRWSRLWFRGRFYLSGLMLVPPMVAAPFYFGPATTPPLGAHILPERQIGPYRVLLAEVQTGPARPGSEGSLLKDYQLSIGNGYPDRIRSVYIRLGPPADDADLGEIMHGNPYRLHAHARFSPDLQGDDRLWLTLVDWDGTRHQASWPLGEAMTKISFQHSKDK